MAPRDTYNASVVSATATRVASNEANALTQQETINLLGAAPNGGTSLAFGVSAANATKIQAANAAYVASKQAAAMTEEVAIDNARATLQATGDVGPR